MLWVCPHALNLPDSFHSIFIISDLSLHPEDFSVSWNPSSSTSSLIIVAPSFYCVCVTVYHCLPMIPPFFCFTDELYVYNNVVIKSIQRTLGKRYCTVQRFIRVPPSSFGCTDCLQNGVMLLCGLDDQSAAVPLTQCIWKVLKSPLDLQGSYEAKRL